MSCADDAFQSSSRFLMLQTILNLPQTSASALLSGYSKLNRAQALPGNSPSLPGRPDTMKDAFAARSLENTFEYLIIGNKSLLDPPLLLLQRCW